MSWVPRAQYREGGGGEGGNKARGASLRGWRPLSGRFGAVLAPTDRRGAGGREPRTAGTPPLVSLGASAPRAGFTNRPETKPPAA